MRGTVSRRFAYWRPILGTPKYRRQLLIGAGSVPPVGIRRRPPKVNWHKLDRVGERARRKYAREQQRLQLGYQVRPKRTLPIIPGRVLRNAQDERLWKEEL